MKKSKKKQKSTFAKNLIERRKALGFSTALDFATEAKIPYPTIRNIEAGVSDGNRETREAIAAALNTTVDDLNTPANVTAIVTSAKDRNAKIVGLVTRISALDDGELDRLSAFVEANFSDSSGSVR